MAESTDVARARPESMPAEPPPIGPHPADSEHTAAEHTAAEQDDAPHGAPRDGPRAEPARVTFSGRHAIVVFTIKVLLAAVVMAATTTMFSLFTWTVLPYSVGWSPSVILTGSMEPSIVPGDIVVTAPIKPEALRLGYVIRFKDPANTHPYLMHRIIEIKDDGTLITKGDANQSQDSTPVPVGNVTGVARLRVPLIGLPAVWLRNQQFLQLGLALVAVAIASRVLTGLRALVAADPRADAADAPEPDDVEPLAEAGDGAEEDGDGAVVEVTGAHAVNEAVAGPVLEVGVVGPAAAAGPTADQQPAARVDAAVGHVPGLPVGRHRGQGRASWRRARTAPARAAGPTAGAATAPTPPPRRLALGSPARAVDARPG